MNGNPLVADHLAEIETRFEAHRAALETLAEQAHESIASGTAALETALPKPKPKPKLDLSSVPDETQPPYQTTRPAPPSAVFNVPNVSEGSLDAGAPAPLLPASLEEIDLDDDGIPLWQD